jgi:hypothetical protein
LALRVEEEEMAIEQSKHDLAMTVLAERWIVEDLRQQNAELLEALEAVKQWNDISLIDDEWLIVMERVNAAIAKAKGE